MAKPHAFSSSAWPKALPISYGPYPVVMDHARDGDTFECFASVGFDSYPIIAVRILGINCPELGEPGGAEAKAFLEALMPQGTPALIRTHGRSFDRWVASVLLADGTDVATEIVRSGFGVWLDY